VRVTIPFATTTTSIPFVHQTRTDDSRVIMPGSERTPVTSASVADSTLDPYIINYVRDHSPVGRQWSIKCSFCCSQKTYSEPGVCGPCDRLRAAWIDNYYRGTTACPFVSDYVAIE